MPRRDLAHPALTALAVGALGVVFGDIGTSPLYTFKTVLDLTGGNDAPTILGVVSLLVWTLIIVTSVKYAGFILSSGWNGIPCVSITLKTTKGTWPPASLPRFSPRRVPSLS